MYKFSLVMIACVVLVGCSSDSDLDQWIEQQKQEQKGKEPSFLKKYKVVAPAPFYPYFFESNDLTSPFDPTRILQEVRKEPGAVQVDQRLLAEWRAEEAREKQHLESIPLESMQMVGFIERKGEMFALINTEGVVYSVKVGDYLGLDKGKIEQITETSIDLRELVQTGQGNIVERFKTLPLQEDKIS